MSRRAGGCWCWWGVPAVGEGRARERLALGIGHPAARLEGLVHEGEGVGLLHRSFELAAASGLVWACVGGLCVVSGSVRHHKHAYAITSTISEADAIRQAAPTHLSVLRACLRRPEAPLTSTTTRCGRLRGELAAYLTTQSPRRERVGRQLSTHRVPAVCCVLPVERVARCSGPWPRAVDAWELVYW